MSEIPRFTSAPMRPDREGELIRDLGRWTRRVREFLGFSQDKLAKLADVSQGAVSRVEAGRGKATPMLTFWKINQVFTQALAEISPEMLSDDAKAMLERARYLAGPVPAAHEGWSPMLDPLVGRVLSTLHELPERERQGFLTVLDATASSLSRHPRPMEEPAVARAARTPN